MPLRLFILISITLLSACSAVTIAPGGAVQGKPTETESRAFYGLGLLGDKNVHTRDYCATGTLQQIRAYRSAADGLLALITLGVYSPMTLDVWCAPPAQEQTP